MVTLSASMESECGDTDSWLNELTLIYLDMWDNSVAEHWRQLDNTMLYFHPSAASCVWEMFV